MPSKMMKHDERSNFKTLIINQSKCQDFDKKQMFNIKVIKKSHWAETSLKTLGASELTSTL